jgi:RNA polymerase sigma-70 factor (ECF subfamily)
MDAHDDDDGRARQIIAEYGSMLRRVASGYVATRGDREELVQDIAMALSHATPSSADESLDRTLVLRVAHNRGVSFSMRKPRDEPLAESSGLIDPRSSPSATVLAEQERERLSACIRRLPEAERQAVMLYLEGLEPREIAAIQGTTDNNVASRLNRAHDALHSMLEGDRQ